MKGNNKLFSYLKIESEYGMLQHNDWPKFLHVRPHWHHSAARNSSFGKWLSNHLSLHWSRTAALRPQKSMEHARSELPYIGMETIKSIVFLFWDGFTIIFSMVRHGSTLIKSILGREKENILEQQKVRHCCSTNWSKISNLDALFTQFVEGVLDTSG